MRNDDFLLFADRAIDRLAGIVADLGDDLANRQPDLPGANSPYQILTHCLGVLDYWVGELIAGRDVQRDRDAEFVATGPVVPLVERAGRAKAQLRDDLSKLRPAEIVAAPPRAWMPVDQDLSQEAALLHALEELYQHLGQLEITRDLLTR